MLHPLLRRFSVRPLLGLLALAAACGAPAHAQDLYVSSNASNTIQRIAPDGTATTFASGLAGPTGIAIDKSGSLYVANNGSVGTILKYAAGSSSPTTFYTQTNAGFQGLTFDSTGNLYASASNTNSILKITPDGTGSTFYSGTGTGVLNGPNALAFDASGNLFVGNTKSAGTNANSLVKIASDGTFSTFSTGIVVPYGLAFDNTGNLYAANGGAANVIKYTTAGGAGTVFVNGLNNPHGAAFDSVGNLYTANTGNNLIIKTDASGNKTTFSNSALLNSPRFVAFSPAPAPEPSSLATFGVAALGLGLLAVAARKRAAAH